MASPMEHEPHGTHQTKKATASGWIGSALEYYDFFIYATAASLIFPQIFFPSTDPKVAIVASLATYGVGYVARPIGAFFLGHWGDTHGRKTVLLVCMFLMGFSTMAVGLLPTYEQVGCCAPMLLVVLRLIQGFAVAGEISGASSMILEHAPFGRRGFFASFTLQGVQAGQILAAAVFLPLAHFLPDGRVQHLGLAHPVPAELRRHRRRLHHPARGRRRRRPSPKRASAATCRRRPIIQAFTRQLAGHAAGRLHGADERHPGGHHDLRRGLRGPAGVRHRLQQGRLPVDPGAGQHRGGAGHPLRRQPVGQDRSPAADHRRRAAFGAAVVRLPLRHQHPQRAAGDRHVAADVGRRLPGLQRHFPELLPRAVPDAHAGSRRWPSRRTSGRW